MALQIGTTDGAWAYGRFRAPDGGAPVAGLVRPAGDVVDLAPHAGALGGPPGDLRALLEDWPAAFATLDGLARTAAPGGLAYADLVPLAPLEPRQVLQSGANYRRHVIELHVREHVANGDTRPEEVLRAEVEGIMDERAASGEPYVFLGAPSAICGARDDVVLPRGAEKPDWELELTAVLHRPARHVGRAEAMEHVAGYTMVNDLTLRDRVYRRDMPVIGTDWLRGKNAPTFLPTGPLFVPAAFVGDPHDLRVRLQVDELVAQDETTADMLFDLPRLVEHVTAHLAITTGDLLLTGSPAGNGASVGRFLTPGTVMVGTITGLGEQRATCVAEAVA